MSRTCFRFALAGIFGYAGYQKLRAPEVVNEFIATVFGADFPSAGFLIGAGEAVLAVLLFLNVGRRLTARAAVIASASFITIHAYLLGLPGPSPPCG